MLSSTRAHENRGAHGTVRAMRVPAQGGAREWHQATSTRTAQSRREKASVLGFVVTRNTNGRRNADCSVGANCTNERADEYSGRYY